VLKLSIRARLGAAIFLLSALLIVIGALGVTGRHEPEEEEAFS